ncbi:MAG: ATP-binding cassette domain-containing protein [Myxococcales bacterium]|nr:ATP-binding cassette domain-containing protein [Myxococcales bacterium]
MPEVVQTSDMDCGPAVLESLLGGYGVAASYERLRELCHTDVDGTSIDRLERAMVGLGLRAQQVLVPDRHVLEPESRSLPALAVLRRPDGFPHFVVLWRRVGPWVMVMDPAVGRRWMTVRSLSAQVLRHEMALPAAAWRRYAGSEEFVGCLRRRLARLQLAELGRELLDEATADPTFRSLAALEAALDTLESLVDAGAVRRGAEAARLMGSLFEHGRSSRRDDPGPIPATAWSVRPIAGTDDVGAVLLVRGAVLVRLKGAPEPDDEAGGTVSLRRRVSPSGPSYRRLLLSLVRAGGGAVVMAVVAGLAAAGAMVMVEAMLLRGLLDVGHGLGRHEQRLELVVAVTAFMLLLLLLEWPIRAAALKMGRQLELRLRLWARDRLPRLPDRYFASRLVSDMAARSHQVSDLRDLPEVFETTMRAGFEMLFVAIGILWLDPGAAWAVVLSMVAAMGLPALVNPWLSGADLRVRTHGGALARFYLDGFLGLLPVRAHGAEAAMLTEHETKLVAWMQAGLRFHQAALVAEAVRKLVVVSLGLWLVLDHVQRSSLGVPMLLVVYWALELPRLGEQIGASLLEIPRLQNTTRRLLEPLQVGVEADPSPPAAPPSEHAPRGVALSLQRVGVHRGGRAILQEVDLEIRPGEHVAIVGESGAGKSSLVGLVLGWYPPSQGELRIDGEPLEGAAIAALRRRCVWVDPGVRLWNRSLLSNLLYASDGSSASFDDVLQDAELWPVIAQLPEGMQTRLGEGGGLVSGGEGQRVRFGRTLAQVGVELAVLDEPFRGLDRPRRRRMLAAARRRWSAATMLCVTHDIEVATGFDRVLVIEGGRVVEQGPPQQLASRPDSAFARLRDAFERGQQELWGDSRWRRLWLEGARVRVEEPPA